jgi:PAS domain-containing protein
MRKAHVHGGEVLAIIEQQQVDGLIIWECDDDKGKVIYCNPSAKRLLGLPDYDFEVKLNAKEFYNVGETNSANKRVFYDIFSRLESSSFHFIGDDSSCRLLNLKKK